MPTEDQRKGKLLPDPVDPGSTVCFTIQIPNAVQYRAAFLGQINILGQWETWDHPTDGTVCEDCEEAAQLWRNAIYGATWSDDCEIDMSCADVADCIENDPAVKQALALAVPAVPIDGMVYPPGVPLTPSQMTERLNEIDECAFDPFWAQVEQYVDYMIDLGQDVLEQIALYSAALDAGENIPMGKFLGKLKGSSSAGKVIEFLQWALETVKAAYEAADNDANRDAIKCAIFCKEKFSCLITIQGTLDTLNERNGNLLNPGDLTDIVTMVDAFMDAFFNPALALDLWLMFLMGSAKTAGMFGLQGIDETLQMVLAVAVNDANNDWETKCDDCAPPVEGLWAIVTDFPGTGGNGGVITSQTENSVTFTAQAFGGEYRIIAQYNDFGSPVTLTSGNVTGPTVATYRGNGPALFAGDWANAPISSGVVLNWVYIAASGPTTLTMNW
jgi:hypothetical protein